MAAPPVLCLPLLGFRLCVLGFLCLPVIRCLPFLPFGIRASVSLFGLMSEHLDSALSPHRWSLVPSLSAASCCLLSLDFILPSPIPMSPFRVSAEIQPPRSQASLPHSGAPAQPPPVVPLPADHPADSGAL